MKIQLDTSAYVGFKRNNAELVDIIVGAELILFSSVVLGELLFGFRSGTRFKENFAELNSFLAHDAVETAAASVFGRSSRSSKALAARSRPKTSKAAA